MPQKQGYGTMTTVCNIFVHNH